MDYSTKSIYRSLLLSRDDYYACYRFADAFARFKRAPERLTDQIRSIFREWQRFRP